MVPKRWNDGVFEHPRLESLRVARSIAQDGPMDGVPPCEAERRVAQRARGELLASAGQLEEDRRGRARPNARGERCGRVVLRRSAGSAIPQDYLPSPRWEDEADVDMPRISAMSILDANNGAVVHP